jgi:hypothetical protein
MLDTKENAIATAQQNISIQPFDKSKYEFMLHEVKLMVVNGKKLSNDEAQALAVYSIQENLDPLAQECWYIPGVGPTPGIRGLRRKAQEQLPPNDYFKVEFRDVSVEERQKDQTILYAYEATLRDTKTSAISENLFPV